MYKSSMVFNVNSLIVILQCKSKARFKITDSMRLTASRFASIKGENARKFEKSSSLMTSEVFARIS